MDFNFTGTKGIMNIEDKIVNISSINVFLKSSESYIQFIDDSNPYTSQFDSYIGNISIDFETDEFNVHLDNVVISGINSGTIEAGKPLPKQTIRAIFIKFVIKKGISDIDKNYTKTFYISNVSFKDSFLLSKFKRTFDISVNDEQIRYRYIKNDEASFEFLTPSKIQDTKNKYIVDILNNLFLIYCGKKFKLDYILIEDENYKEIYGNINENYPFLKEGIFHYEFINIFETRCFKDFVESTFNTYDSKQKHWGLNLLIDYFISYYHTSFTEIGFLYLSIFFESLKNSYAKNIQKYTQNKNNFFINPNTKKTFSFKDLVKEIGLNLNIQSIDTSFIKIRNELIHTGYIQKINICDVQRLENQVKEVILSLIGFTGKAYFRNIKSNEIIEATLTEYQKIKLSV